MKRLTHEKADTKRLAWPSYKTVELHRVCKGKQEIGKRFEDNGDCFFRTQRFASSQQSSTMNRFALLGLFGLAALLPEVLSRPQVDTQRKTPPGKQQRLNSGDVSPLLVVRSLVNTFCIRVARMFQSPTVGAFPQEAQCVLFSFIVLIFLS